MDKNETFVQSAIKHGGEVAPIIAAFTQENKACGLSCGSLCTPSLLSWLMTM